MHMAYEAPELTEVGTVRDLTLGFDTWAQWDDEMYVYKYKVPLPGSGLS